MRTAKSHREPIRKMSFLKIAVSILFVVFVFSAIARSELIGVEARHNVVVIEADGDILLLSYSPVEKKVVHIALPAELRIRSRSVGSYRVSNLLQLGEYQGDRGEFVRAKVQGFIKVPVPNYLIINEANSRARIITRIFETIGKAERTNMALMDMILLIYRSLAYEWEMIDEEALVAKGVLRDDGDGYAYDERALTLFARETYLDWVVSQEGLSVTVVNQSEEDGLGTDVGSFIENVGMNLVQIKRGDNQGGASQVVVSGEHVLNTYSYHVISKFLGIGEYLIEDTHEERADIVVRVRDDMKTNF